MRTTSGSKKMSQRSLIVIGSRTKEDKYGVESGTRVASALRRRGWEVQVIHASDGQALMRHLLDTPPDVVVPVGFGAPCEDGHVFAAARLAGVPCAGPTPAAGGLMQDKSMLSLVVDGLFDKESGVRSPRGVVVTRHQCLANLEREILWLAPPLLVKPACSGSSDGLALTESYSDAITAAKAMLAYEGKVLIQQLERRIEHEVSCTVLDGPDGPRFLPIVELRRDGDTPMTAKLKFGAEGLGRHIIPARVSVDAARKIERAVLDLQDAVGAIGLTRTDILVLADGEIVILEMNAIPGLLTSSIACDAARAAGIDFDELCVRYLGSAFAPRAEPDIWAVRA
jgi:D-alanine-D-alanine ligase